jgi:predicted small lipoprotein YifL
MKTLLLAATLFAATSCGSGPPPDDPNRPDGAVQIEVVNRNFNQATLWANGPTGRRRIGIVDGKTTRTFTLDWPFPGLLQIETQILSDGRCLTDQLETDPGDLLYLEVPLEPQRDRSCT